MPSSFERIHVRDDDAARLADAGVEVGLSPLSGPSEVRTLRHLAGIAVANGLPHARALAALTTVPVRAFGVDRGTLERGEVADLVVWTGDPFELATHAERVIIAGIEQPLTTRQTEAARPLPRPGPAPPQGPARPRHRPGRRGPGCAGSDHAGPPAVGAVTGSRRLSGQGDDVYTKLPQVIIRHINNC